MMTGFLLAMCLQGGATLPSDTGALLERPWIQLGEQREVGSLAVVWQGPADQRAYELEYGQSGTFRKADQTSRLIDLVNVDPHRVYTATLTGLRPGKATNYRLKLAGTTLFEGQTVAPKNNRQPTKFVVFGDCGIGTPSQALVAKQVYAQRPDYVMITGDIVYNKGEINEYRKNFFPYYATDDVPLLSSSLVIGVPGNHDILLKNFTTDPDSLAYFYYWSQPLNGPVTRLDEPNATPFRASYPARKAFYRTAGDNFPRMANFSFDYGNAHWLCLDANPTVDWTNPKLRQWVLNDLKSSPKTWKFVSFHQPGFHSSPIHQEEKQMRQAAELFEDGGADVVFAGHVHNYQRSFPIQVGPKRGAARAELAKDDWPIDATFDGKTNTRPRGVVYIVDGAGGAGLYNVELNGKRSEWKSFQAEYIADFSFSLVNLDNRTLTLSQIDKDGQERDRFTITK